ncbi:MAG: DUF5615 family PIN-like protein [Planctomycetota bacterium]
MRVLVDECVPRRLVAALVGVDVTHVPDAGWAGKQNGELLGLADGKCDVLVTIDQNLEHQQNLAGRQLGVIVMVAPSNRFDALASLASLVPGVLEALERIQPGHFIYVGAQPVDAAADRFVAPLAFASGASTGPSCRPRSRLIDMPLGRPCVVSGADGASPPLLGDQRPWTDKSP